MNVQPVELVPSVVGRQIRNERKFSDGSFYRSRTDKLRLDEWKKTIVCSEVQQ